MKRISFHGVIINEHSVGATVYTILNTGNHPVTLLLKGNSYEITGVAQDIPVQTKFYELAVDPVGGTSATNAILTNQDRENVNYDETVTFLEGATTDLTGATVLMLDEDVAVKQAVTRSSNINLFYNLKKNMNYVLETTVLEGTQYGVRVNAYFDLMIVGD